jgi:hypothetical protein
MRRRSTALRVSASLAEREQPLLVLMATLVDGNRRAAGPCRPNRLDAAVLHVLTCSA